MNRFISALLLALTSAIAVAAPLPSSFTATYTVSRGNIAIGEMQRSLTPVENSQIKFESDMHATGFVAAFVKDELSESTLLSYQAEQIRPQLYTYNKTGGKKTRETRLVFDWKNNIVKNIVAEKEWEMPLQPGAQDKLSYQLAIMQDLAQGKTEFEYPIADKKEFKIYRFKVIGNETLDTPMGSLETFKVQRVMESDEKTTTLWCAPSLQYLPVRIEQNEKSGDEFSLLIQSVKGLSSQETSRMGDAK